MEPGNLIKVTTEQELFALKQSVVKSQHQKTKIQFICKACKKETTRRLLNNRTELFCPVCISKQSFLEKYGVENPSQLQSVKNKKKETTLQHYGVENPMQSKKVVQTLQQHNIEKYGVENPSQCTEVKEKHKQTCLEKYGVDSFSKTPFYKEKCKEAWQKKTTEELKSIEEKRKQNCLEKYGNENFNNREKFKTSLQQKYEEEKTVLEKRYGPITSSGEIAEQLAMDLSHINSFLKRNYKVFGFYKNYITSKNAKEAYNILKDSSGGFSYEEKELTKYIKNIYVGPVLENVKKVIGKKELDIYLPEKCIAIEFNGLYWHSDKGGLNTHDVPNNECIQYAKNRHLEKTKACEEKGIKLIHVFEDDWLYKKDIVKALIKQKLGIDVIKVFARKCSVASIDNISYKTFLEKYHLQGYSVADIRLGLFYKGELIEVMGIKSKGNHTTEPELVRLCAKENYIVVGGFSKLLKHCDLKQKIISYIDIGTFTGNGYKATGWKEVKRNPPAFYYINLKANGTYRIPRTKLMKKTLQKKLKNFNEKLTEAENLYKHGYAKIWNCGTIKVEWNPKL